MSAVATIIDLTRAWQGSEAAVLAAVLDAMPPETAGRIEVRAFSAQHPAVAPVAGERGARVEVVGDGSPEPVVAASIGESIQQHLQQEEIVRVYSFSPHIKQEAASWSAMHPSRVIFVPLAPFAVAQARETPPPPVWDESFMSQEEAARVLVQALGNTLAGALPKVELRTVLQVLDPRFSKDAGGFAAQARFISLVVDAAVSRGWVRVEGAGPNPRVALTEAGAAMQQRSGASQVRSDAGEVAHVPGGPEEVDGEKRSQTYLDAWRAANLGPFMKVRTAVYAEMEASIAQGPKPLKRLVGDAAAAVREREPSQVGPKYPWSRVKSFVEALMRRRPVAFSHGEPVVPSLREGLREVTALDEGWQLKLDGELVLHLLERGFELRLDDLPDLAGALYDGRGQDEIDRAYDVVERLAIDGLLEEPAPGEPFRRILQAQLAVEPPVLGTVVPLPPPPPGPDAVGYGSASEGS